MYFKSIFKFKVCRKLKKVVKHYLLQENLTFIFVAEVINFHLLSYTEKLIVSSSLSQCTLFLDFKLELIHNF